jgi:DNA-binding MarR family transcriptional regulator
MMTSRSQPPALEPLRELARALLRFHRRRRMLLLEAGVPVGEAGADLTFAQENVLTLIQGSSSPPSIGSLAEAMECDQGWISRLVAQLVKRKLVLRKSSKQQRSIQLVLSASGLETLRELDEVNFEVMRKALCALTEAQQEELSAYFCRLANALNAPSLIKRAETHALHFELGRLSRCTGFLTDTLWHTHTKLFEAYIFDELMEPRPYALTAANLVALLPTDQSSISRILQRLHTQGLITSTAKQKRDVELRITARGQQEWRKLGSAGHTKLSSVFPSFSVDAVEKLTRLLLLASTRVVKSHFDRAPRTVWEELPAEEYTPLVYSMHEMTAKIRASLGIREIERNQSSSACTTKIEVIRDLATTPYKLRITTSNGDSALFDLNDNESGE